VVGAAGEVVREGLLGDVELVVGSAGSGNNQRRLPMVGCSQRKMTVGELLLPDFASRHHGKFSVQEGHNDEALLLLRSEY
jgi:hypothetical protein